MAVSNKTAKEIVKEIEEWRVAYGLEVEDVLDLLKLLTAVDGNASWVATTRLVHIMFRKLPRGKDALTSGNHRNV